ncbi:acetylxylan esterase [bacterium]|nr:acetylxylan esterase [bacterium]
MPRRDLRISRLPVSLVLLLSFFSALRFSEAAGPRVLPEGEVPNDARLGDLKDLNGYFPFQPSESPEAWAKRREYVKRQMLLACGLWPMPPRPAITAEIHGRVDRDEYTVDRVIFESSPGLLVTGSLYKPKKIDGKAPVILCPHGHWSNGRFHDHGDAGIKRELDSDAEIFEIGGRHPLQARSVQLARMGCIVFLYDMQGYADGGSFTFELIHRFGKQRPALSSPDNWGMFSAQSELRLFNALGLQTWNSIRAVDWLSSLPDVDTSRIGVTGASGGGTQTFMLAALDDRIAAAFPAVMVSTAMQGGCTCENATYLRVNTGNIEFAAMVAPRPIYMSGANDWTVEIEKKGLPELKQHFAMLGVPDNVNAKWFDYPHNFNRHSRAMMYDFFNRFLKLGFDEIVERDYVPLTQAEATVFDDANHQPPERTEEAEAALLDSLDESWQQEWLQITPTSEKGLAAFRRVVGGAIDVMVGRGMSNVGDVEYDKKSETERDGYHEYTALLRAKKFGEELPTIFLYPTDWNNELVIWIDGAGKSGLYADDGSLIAPVAKLVKKGYAIASADLLYTGEYLEDGQSLTQARVVNNPREFAGYTLGYNHSLFAQRVHDILTLISFSQRYKSKPEQIHLVGVNGGGIFAAAAGAQSHGALASLAVDTQGYRFESITDIRDVNLFPGAVKYGDVPALIALNAPTRTFVAGESLDSAEALAAPWAVGKAGNQMTLHGRTDEPVPLRIAEWIAE